MDKKFYEEYYFLERNHWWFQIRAKMISNFVKDYFNNKTDLKILNVGIATGLTTEILSSYGNVTSIEYDKDCCEFVREKLNIEVINGSVTEIPFEPKEFDLVCAFDVIEHVKEDDKAVNELYRVCKDNGLIFITVPAFMSLWSEHDDINHHFKRYVMKEIIELFKNLKGQVIYNSYFNFLLFIPILAFRLISKVLPKKAIRKGSGSDFNVIDNKSFINKILYNIFNLEIKLIKSFKYPFGVSIMYMFKKIDS
ncbi:MAG: methyltransferase domain-containing protein [Candidatus Sericytochromatia bacterium]